MVRQILLTRGKIALVDDVDFERVSAAGSWVAIPSTTCPGRWYAYRSLYRPKRSVYLHRFILDAPRGIQVDHANGDGLDCRRDNLRLATRSQNCANSRKRADAKSSNFKGVTYIGPARWQAQLTFQNKQRVLGIFPTEEEAARAYDADAERCWGPFARPNFPIFVPGRGVPGVVQHSLPLTEAARTGHVTAPGRRSAFLRDRRQA